MRKFRRARRAMPVLNGVLFLGGVFTTVSPALAQWPQWGGPQRNFRSESTRLADSWPESGPRRIWSRELGDGYSALIVDEGRLFTMTRRGDQEVVVALDAATGAPLWEQAYAAPFEAGMEMEFGPGPHSTPLVVGSQVFTVGVTVQVHSFDKATGKVIWQRDLRKDLDASHMERGYGASPMAFKDTLILPAGGKGSGLIALEQATGKTRWANLNYQPTYGSPIQIAVDGQPQIVAFMGSELVGVNPETGAELWRHPHETTFDANISTPVWSADGLLFCTSAYNNGSRVIRLTRAGDQFKTEDVWFNRKMRVHFGNVIRDGDYVYGSSGDMGPTFLMCLDVRDGKLMWQERGFGKASLLWAEGKLIVLGEDGLLALVRCTPEKCDVLARTQLLQRVAWTVPTLVGTTLYVRDRKSIMALDLGAAEQR